MMKKVLIFLCLVSTWMNWSQTNPIQDIKMSPNGYFDAVMDRFGNKYQLKDLQITNQVFTKSAALSCDSGIFELYFEPGCGMDNTADAANNARRAVVCQVLKDVSDFINTPLKNAGNTTKVKIWVRNPANLSTPMPADALGSASSFYTMPYSTVSNFGGIIDGEVYKTIQGGKDSFINVDPLVNTNGTTSSGNYYHGMMVFNFTSFNWNTNLSANASSIQYDLYSVVLHEITHALGFNSLLDKDGNSVFGLGFKYYTRYDRFLKNNADSQFLLTNTGACSTMYNYAINSSLSSTIATILEPNASNCITNQTTCSSALKFVGTNTIPIYTPNCFDKGSSYSHFEDMCIPAPNTGNDTYFAMSNAQRRGMAKRFLKPEERTALIDLGYSLNTTYGNNTVVIGSFNNYGGAVITGLDVAGINDGISNTGAFSFVGNAGNSITISGILANDYNATSFECVEDIFDSTANISTSGTTISFTSSIAGFHLLRYVPKNSLNKRGNITYIYVYVNETDNCAIPTSCDLVLNGNFEQYSSLPTNLFHINRACGWMPANQGSPDYYHTNGAFITQVPCNVNGYESDNLNLNAYAGIFVVDNYYSTGKFYESIRTKLVSPLLPNNKYSLSFDVSLAEGYSTNASKIQAYLSNDFIFQSGNGPIPITNPSLFFESPYTVTTSYGWEKIIFNFTTGNISGEQYLYLGALKNVLISQISSTNVPVPVSCTNFINQNEVVLQNGGAHYYYIDNVSLIPLNGANFDLPAQVCNTVTLSNLTNYLTATPTNGVFSGSGVVNTGGTYSFNATTAGVGTHTISYTYNNSSGCSVTISDTVTVVNTNIIVPTFNPIAPVCPGTTPVLPTISTNGITGTWALTSSTATSLVYTFTPTAGQCTSPTLTTRTVTILPATDPSCGGGCQNAYTLSVPEANASITYRALNTIESNTNYQVATGKQVTMKCENSISFKPGTYLNNGSTVWAKIQPCSDPSKIVINDVNNSKLDSNKNDSSEIAESNKISLFPNPSDSMITIQTGVSNQLAINIYTLDGKLIYQNAVNQSSLDIDVSSFVQGMYLVEIKVDENLIKKVKFVKN